MAQPKKKKKKKEKRKIRAEINEIETIKTIKKINNTKTWFCLKINITDKPFSRLLRGKTQIN